MVFNNFKDLNDFKDSLYVCIQCLRLRPLLF